jgi:hypothetical protein
MPTRGVRLIPIDTKRYFALLRQRSFQQLKINAGRERVVARVPKLNFRTTHRKELIQHHSQLSPQGHLSQNMAEYHRAD